MADISDKFRKVEEKLDMVLKNKEKFQPQNQVQSEESLEILENLPLTSDSSFVDLNERMSKDKHLRHLIVKVLISVGGRDMRSHINNMLRRILSDEVAEQYSISGKSLVKNMSKKPFLATEIAKSIFHACQSVFRDLATEVKMKEAVGDWLNQAKVRRTRRMQRQGKNVENID
ncbi:uncharacterized protein LOC129217500 [Uloborus diversus]|uniref:uncharacterized protein LOC129217500 n=1 Tax=Uloborus diversus TaxID=327109 RepID=UPI002409457F|nr:uncharacterized protein LOC129217500 [Uloborus diversus]